MAQADDVALTERRQLALRRLRTLTAGQLARVWDSLGSYGEEDQARWARQAGPVVTAGQNRAVDLQIAYLSARLGERVAFSRSDILAKAVLDITEPFYAFGRALNSGREFRDALEAGRLRAWELGETGVEYAHRSAASTADGRVRGWRRQLVGNTCEWCVVVSTQRYRTAESASFGHRNCDCEPVPIIGDSDPGRVINQKLLGELKRSGAVDRASALRAQRRAAARSS